MRQRHDYIVPYFNNRYRFDKPPFIYWTQVASYSVFGENDFAARFPSAVAASLTAVLLFAWGRRLGNERIGWWAAIIFSLCLQTFIHAKAAVADMWLVFFVTAAYWGGYEIVADLLGGATPPRAPSRAHWRIVFYLALAFGFLAKGPLGWLPLLSVACIKFIAHGHSLNRRFWFLSGVSFTLVLVLLWGIPALIRTNGEFFWVGIGRHVVERSFGAMEGHGGQTWLSYFLTLPFYFGMIFISFFPWSVKLPALVKHLWRNRDQIDTYLASGVAIVFLLMTVVKTKLPHYTLIAFPLLALLLARYLVTLPGSFRFVKRTAIVAAMVSISISLLAFPFLAPTFPSAELFKAAKNDLLPEMHFGNVDYPEPSVVWYFRSRVHGYFWGVNPEDVKKFMEFWGPKFIILPTDLAKNAYPELPVGWTTYSVQGFAFAKGKRVSLTIIIKPTE
jgi:4-amino-4-deoxy-L-arabinose transferase-like glycosyltransferase